MVHHPAGPSDHRRGWIALAAAGPVAGCGDTITTAEDAGGFLTLLDESRPRIAIVTEPPATADLVERLALERQRRTTLRIVHVAPDDAVDRRLHALRLGFDDALTLGIRTTSSWAGWRSSTRTRGPPAIPRRGSRSATTSSST